MFILYAVQIKGIIKSHGQTYPLLTTKIYVRLFHPGVSPADYSFERTPRSPMLISIIARGSHMILVYGHTWHGFKENFHHLGICLTSVVGFLSQTNAPIFNNDVCEHKKQLKWAKFGVCCGKSCLANRILHV